MYVPFEYNNKKVIYGADYLKSSKEIIISKVLADSLRGSIDYNDLICIFEIQTNETIKVVKKWKTQVRFTNFKLSPQG